MKKQRVGSLSVVADSTTRTEKLKSCEDKEELVNDYNRALEKLVNMIKENGDRFGWVIDIALSNVPVKYKKIIGSTTNYQVMVNQLD